MPSERADPNEKKSGGLIINGTFTESRKLILEDGSYWLISVWFYILSFHSKIQYTVPLLLYIYFLIWIFFLLIIFPFSTILLPFTTRTVWWLICCFWLSYRLEVLDYSIYWMMTLYHLVVMTPALFWCSIPKGWWKVMKYFLRSSDLLWGKKLFCIN